MAKRNIGKIIGGGLGWAFGGPIGALVGVVLGSLVDTAEVSEPTFSSEPKRQQQRSGINNDFVMSVLVLSAAVMKADGRQLKSELQFIKSFFVRNFGDETTLEALRVLKGLLERPISVREVSMQIRQNVNHSGRLQMMHYLFGIAASDGQIAKEEEDLLHRIAGYFYVNDSDYQSIRAMFVPSTDAAYLILEVDPKADDETIKKAYRRMALRYHPDKVASLGEEAAHAAKEKFQKVQQAYEDIRKERGLK